MTSAKESLILETLEGSDQKNKDFLVEIPTLNILTSNSTESCSTRSICEWGRLRIYLNKKSLTKEVQSSHYSSPLGKYQD